MFVEGILPFVAPGYLFLNDLVHDGRHESWASIVRDMTPFHYHTVFVSNTHSLAGNIHLHWAIEQKLLNTPGVSSLRNQFKKKTNQTKPMEDSKHTDHCL